MTVAVDELRLTSGRCVLADLEMMVLSGSFVTAAAPGEIKKEKYVVVRVKPFAVPPSETQTPFAYV